MMAETKEKPAAPPILASTSRPLATLTTSAATSTASAAPAVSAPPTVSSSPEIPVIKQQNAWE